jgi:hypothetical protein
VEEEFNGFFRRREIFVTRISFFRILLGFSPPGYSFPQGPWKDQKVRIEEPVARADCLAIY